MPMTLVVARNVPERVRGFLASMSVEVAPTVYTAPDMTKGVRERMIAALIELFEPAPDRSILITWPEKGAPGGQAFRVIGAELTKLVEYEGVWLARRAAGS